MKALDLRDTILKARNTEGVLDLYATNYDRFDLFREDNTFWISPSSEKPSFKHNKYFFSNHEKGVKIGLHIEKGIEVETSKEDQKLIMDATWNWHEFLKSVDRGLLFNAVKEQVVKTKKPIFVEANMYYYKSKSEGVQDRLSCKILNVGGEFTGDIDDLQNLSFWIRKQKDLKWKWCNIFIYQIIGKKELEMLGNITDFNNLFDKYLGNYNTFIY